MSNEQVTTVADIWKTVLKVCAAFGAGFYFCYNVFMPTHTEALRNEIKANADLVAKASATAEKAASLERQLKDALGRVKALEKPNLFSLGNPYPVGLGLVRAGQSIDDVEKAYLGAKVEKKEKGYWTFKNVHSVFSDVTYYFDDTSPEKKITHIRFAALSEAGKSDNFLKNKLIETLGPPTDNPSPDKFRWKASEVKSSVYYEVKYVPAFIIMSEAYVLPGWPPPKPPATTGAVPSTKVR
jgi:hypothetical protein